MSHPVSCTDNPANVAAYTVYNAGGCVILGIARAIISAVGYIYYSCFSTEAKAEAKSKIKAEKGGQLDRLAANVSGAVRKGKERISSAASGETSNAQAKKVFASQFWRGLAEITVVGGWYHTYRDYIDYEDGLFGMGELEKGFSKLDKDLSD